MELMNSKVFYKNTKGIILIDLDGTLIEDQESTDNAIKRIYELADKYVKISLENFIFEFRKLSKFFWHSIVFPDGQFIDHDEIEGLWCDYSYKIFEHDEHFSKYIKKFRNTFWTELCLFFEIPINPTKLSNEFIRIKKRIKVYDGVISVLEYLSLNYSLVLVTNGISPLQQYKIDNSNIEHLFERIVISGEVGFDKPKKEFFEIALQGYDSKIATYIIGDNYEKDILGGWNMGIKTVFLLPHNNNNNNYSQATYICSSFYEVINLFRSST